MIFLPDLVADLFIYTKFVCRHLLVAAVHVVLPRHAANIQNNQLQNTV